MLDRIYEHLKTRKKYNTLENKYETLSEELERKCFELRVERKIKEKQQDIFNEKLHEFLKIITKLKEENLDLKQKITELKKEIKKNGTKSV